MVSRVRANCSKVVLGPVNFPRICRLFVEDHFVECENLESWCQGSLVGGQSSRVKLSGLDNEKCSLFYTAGNEIKQLMLS